MRKQNSFNTTPGLLTPVSENIEIHQSGLFLKFLQLALETK
jgi:hypothetical protein